MPRSETKRVAAAGFLAGKLGNQAPQKTQCRIGRLRLGRRFGPRFRPFQSSRELGRKIAQRAVDLRLREPGCLKIGAFEVGAFEVGAGEAADEHGPAKVGVPEVGPLEVGIFEFGTGQASTFEVSAA